MQVFRKVLDVANISPCEPVLKLFPIFYLHNLQLYRKKIGRLEPINREIKVGLGTGKRSTLQTVKVLKLL